MVYKQYFFDVYMRIESNRERNIFHERIISYLTYYIGKKERCAQ